MGIVPSIMVANVDVGIGLPPITGPLGNSFGPITLERGDTNLALGDTGFIPVMLGWDAGNFHWSGALFVLAPTGDYSTRQLANTSLNRWALMPRLAATYFDPKSGWQVNGVAVYAVSCRNDATKDYRSFGRHPQSGRFDPQEFRQAWSWRSRLRHNFKRRPIAEWARNSVPTRRKSTRQVQIVTYSFGDPRDPLTFVA